MRLCRSALNAWNPDEHVAVSRATASIGSAGDRAAARHRTFLFPDIEGSTTLLNELGAERYAEALAEQHRVLRDAFTRHGGVEVDTQGDAFFVAFPTAPLALHLGPQRYYHRPRARDDAHGYRKPSRFLTERLQELCVIVHADGGDTEPLVGVGTGGRIEVSLDHLFG
jgi:class 3 adenylate cyclase